MQKRILNELLLIIFIFIVSIFYYNPELIWDIMKQKIERRYNKKFN